MTVAVRDLDKQDRMAPPSVALVNNVMKQIKKARVTSLTMEPFIATPALSMGVRVCVSVGGRPVPTAATTGKMLYVNPHHWSGLTLGQQITISLHEFWHVALGHHLRRGTRNPNMWNYACDYRINIMLRDAKYEPIKGWLCDDKYRGWSEERIYSALKDQEEEKGEGEGEEKGTEPGEEEGEGGGQSGEEGEEECNEPEDSEDSNEEGDDPTATKDGDDEGDEDSEEEGNNPGRPKPDDSLIGEVWDGEDEDGNVLDEEEKRNELDDIKTDISLAKNMEKIAAGKSSGGTTERVVDGYLNTQVSWRQQLERKIRKVGSVYGRSWHALDRRSLAHGVYQPAELYEGVEWLVIGFDVSSSIDYRECKAFVSAINEIKDTFPINKMTIVPFNHVVLMNDIVELSKYDHVPNNFNVSGGTCFARVFNWVARQNGKPDAIIIFTDLGDETYGEAPIGVPVIWASSQPIFDMGNYSNRPPFGDVIEVSIDD